MTRAKGRAQSRRNAMSHDRIAEPTRIMVEIDPEALVAWMWMARMEQTARRYRAPIPLPIGDAALAEVIRAGQAALGVSEIAARIEAGEFAGKAG